MKAVEAKTIFRGKYLILDLDFSEIDFHGQSVEKMIDSVRDYVNDRIRSCWSKYAAHLGLPGIGPAEAAVHESNCVSALNHLIGRVERKWTRENPLAVPSCEAHCAAGATAECPSQSYYHSRFTLSFIPFARSGTGAFHSVSTATHPHLYQFSGAAVRHIRSLLVHLGFLTCKKALGSNELGIPNLIARRRVAEMLLCQYGLRDSQSLVTAQDQLLLHDNVQPLLTTLTQVLRHTIRSAQQLNQLSEADLETHLACLIHTPPPSCMQPEYEVFAGKNSRTGDKCARYVDIVIQTRKAGIASTLWVLELKNARHLDPTSFPAGTFPAGRYPPSR